MGLFQLIAENARALRARDDKYLRSFVYFFELRIPAAVAAAAGSTPSLIYPLIIPPESYRMSEPFAVEKTPTNQSGLYIEENGILYRELSLSGTTGWKPRRFPKNTISATAGVVLLPPEGRSHSRTVPFNIVEELSGQRHFQFLQDAVFRTYGDLKRDPSTSHDTELYFHNPKDDEHWRCIPERFEVSRDKSSQSLYRYDIQLLLVEGAAQLELRPTEDYTVLEALKNANLMLNYGVSLINSGLTDLSGVQEELRIAIQGSATILADVATIAAATTSFLQGTAQLITVPYAAVLSAGRALETALGAFNEAVILGSSGDVSGSVLNAFMRIGDGLDAIASYPDKFQKSVDAAVASFTAKQDISTSRTSAQLSQASTAAPPQTLRAFDSQGTALLPGDYVRASNELGLGRNTPRYQSAIERVIEHGDTLPNLAARYLGDARLWKFLAVFNDLRPPYISASGLPGTLTVGDPILVPSTSKAPEQRSTPTVLGVLTEAPAEEHALGTDFQLVEVSRGQYDWAIDPDTGDVDAKIVSGVKNLQQGIRTRLITERGSDILYKQLGVQRVVGLGLTIVDLETAQLRLVESVQQDPRVAGVRNVEFQNGPPDDALYVEMDVEVRGLTRPQKIIVRE